MRAFCKHTEFLKVKVETTERMNKINQLSPMTIGKCLHWNKEYPQTSPQRNDSLNSGRSVCGREIIHQAHDPFLIIKPNFLESCIAIMLMDQGREQEMRRSQTSTTWTVWKCFLQQYLIWKPVNLVVLPCIFIQPRYFSIWEPWHPHAMGKLSSELTGWRHRDPGLGSFFLCGENNIERLGEVGKSAIKLYPARWCDSSTTAGTEEGEYSRCGKSRGEGPVSQS